MKKIILSVFVVCFSCSDDNPKDILNNEKNHDLISLSFKDNITPQKVERFIVDSQIDGLNCSILEVSESQNRVEINLEFTVRKSSTFSYENLSLSANIGDYSFSVPFHENNTNGDMVKKATIKFSFVKSDDAGGESRPFVSISGSVSENLGDGSSGKSSSFFSVWDLFK